MAHDPERRTRNGPAAPLDTQQIVDAAMALTRREGLQGLTMRKLAGALGVTSMAPYHHFPSKEKLVEAITEQVFAQVKIPDAVPDDTWDECLRRFGWAVHDVLVEYPGVADQIYTYQRFPLSAVPLVDHAVGTLEQAGFDERAAAEAFDVLASVVITRTHFEAHQRLVTASHPETSVDDRVREGWQHLEPAIDDSASAARDYVDQLDRSMGPRIFARALDVVLAGLRAELAEYADPSR
jgi:AcrR family transcriptional regulator